VSKDNKWIIAETNWGGGKVVTTEYRIYWFKDEVEIGGSMYLQLYTALLGNPVFEATETYYREQYSRVHKYDKRSGNFDVIYNFKTENGDELYLPDTYSLSIEGEIVDLKSFAFLDRSCVTSQIVDVTLGGGWHNFEDTFVERMGSLTYPFRPGMFYHDYKQHIACFIHDDTLLYSSDSDLSFCSQFGALPPEVNLLHDFSDCGEDGVSTTYLSDGDEINIYLDQEHIFISGMIGQISSCRYMILQGGVSWIYPMNMAHFHYRNHSLVYSYA